MKKYIVSAVSLIAFAFLSCDLEMPEKVSVKNNGSYDFRVGEFKLKDHFSAEDVLDSIDTDDVENKLKVYEFNPKDDKTNSMKFLFNYDLASIPLDFNEYLDKMDMNDKMSKDISKTFTIDPVDDVEFNNVVDFQTVSDKICGSMQNGFSATSIKVYETGIAPPVALDTNIPGITDQELFSNLKIKIESPDFKTIEFRDGILEVKLSRAESDNPLSGDFTFYIEKAELFVAENESPISTALGGEFSDGGTLNFNLAGQTLSKSITVKMTGQYGGGSLGTLHQYNVNADLINSDINRITGLTMGNGAEGSSDAPVLISDTKSVALSDSLPDYIIFSKIGKGFLDVSCQVPDGWTGVKATPKITAAGGLVIDAGDLKDVAGSPANMIINKHADLSDKELSNDDIDLTYSISFSFNNATLVLANTSETVEMKGKCSIESMKEVVVDINGLISVSDLESKFREELDSSITSTVNKITLDNLIVKGSFVHNFGETDLGLTATFDSDLFQINNKVIGPKKISDPAPQINEKLNDDAVEIVFTDSTVADFTTKVALSGSDEENPTYVKFYTIEFGKEYKLEAAFEVSFDMISTELNADTSSFSGEVETGLNISEMIGDIAGDKQDIKDQLEKLKLKDGSVKAYIIITKPEVAAGKQDPLKDLVIKGKVLSKYSKKNEPLIEKYIIGSETDDDAIALKNTVDFDKYADENHTITDLSESKLLEMSSTETDVFSEIINERPDVLNIEYTMSLSNNDGSGTLTITQDQIDTLKESGSTSINVQAAILMPFEFEITDDIELNVRKIMDEDYIAGDDLFNRDDKDEWEDRVDITDIVKLISLKFETKDIKTCLPADTKVKINQKWSDTDFIDKEIVINENDQGFYIDLTAEEAKTVMTNYPFDPEITVILPKSDLIYFPKDLSVKARVNITTDGTYEIWNKEED
ncbi:MAG: hypothetical protein KBS64_05210 [Treponema sp.]|nr:hypothetical protein [Candidatus Treponema equi]